MRGEKEEAIRQHRDTARLLKADCQALPRADLVTELHLPAGAWLPCHPLLPHGSAVLQLPPPSLQERLTCYRSKTGFNPTDNKYFIAYTGSKRLIWMVTKFHGCCFSFKRPMWYAMVHFNDDTEVFL